MFENVITSEGTVFVSAAEAVPIVAPSISGLPAPPSPTVEPYVDATLRCISRYGIAHTSVPDIAREAGVSRATIYRHVGTVDDAIRLSVARELDHFLAKVPELLGERPGAESVVEVLAWFVEYADQHPAWQKVVRDEPDRLGHIVVESLGDAVETVKRVVIPWLRAGMDAGLVARRDPEIVAEWLTRVVLTLVTTPPTMETRVFLREVVGPLLVAPSADSEDRS